MYNSYDKRLQMHHPTEFTILITCSICLFDSLLAAVTSSPDATSTTVNAPGNLVVRAVNWIDSLKCEICILCNLWLCPTEFL